MVGSENALPCSGVEMSLRLGSGPDRERFGYLLALVFMVMASRFEFDPVNNILMIRFEGRVTDELLAEGYRAAQQHAAAMDAKVSVMDCSGITQFAVSPEVIRQLANQQPILADARSHRFIVAPKTAVFGLARMFQIQGESTRPLLQVLHTMDEVWAALGIQSPHFEPLA